MPIINDVTKPKSRPHFPALPTAKEITSIPPELASFFKLRFEQAAPQTIWDRYRAAVATLTKYKDASWDKLGRQEQAEAQAAIDEAGKAYDEIFEKWRGTLAELNLDKRNDKDMPGSPNPVLSNAEIRRAAPHLRATSQNAAAELKAASDQVVKFLGKHKINRVNTYLYAYYTLQADPRLSKLVGELRDRWGWNDSRS